MVFTPGTRPRTAEGGFVYLRSPRMGLEYRIFRHSWLTQILMYCNNNTSPTSLLESMWGLRFTMKPQRCCPEITRALEEQRVVEGLPAYCLHMHEVCSAAQQNKGIDNLLLLTQPRVFIVLLDRQSAAFPSVIFLENRPQAATVQAHCFLSRISIHPHKNPQWAEKSEAHICNSKT